MATLFNLPHTESHLLLHLPVLVLINAPATLIGKGFYYFCIYLQCGYNADHQFDQSGPFGRW